MTRERKSAVVRITLPIAIVAAGATVALRCGEDTPIDPMEVRRAALVLPMGETSTSWWRVRSAGSEPIHHKPLAAGVSTSRGTEIFGLFLDPDGSDIGVSGTKSNIELRAPTLSFVGSSALDNASLAATSASGGTTIDVFWRLADQTLATRTWDGTAFVVPANLPPFGLVLAGAGAAGQTDREDLFVIGLDHNLWQAWRATGAWNGWIPLGAPTGGLASLQPAAVYLPGSLLYVFTVAADDGTVRTINNPNVPAWSPWTSVGSNVSSGIAATFSGTSRIDIFAVDPTGTIKWRTLDTSTRTSTSPGTWTTWASINPPPAGIVTTTIDGLTRFVAPTAIARGEGAIDLFVRDTNGDVQLMTIRPVPSLSGSLSDNKERALAPASCANLTGGWGENTAAAMACGGVAYDFLFSSATEILRAPESCFLSSSPPPNSCAVPSGGPAIKACTPFETTLSFANGFTVPNQPTITITGGGADNQMARVKDLTSTSLILISHQQIRSQAPPGPGCSISPRTSGDLMYQSTDCGTTWSAVGALDMCKVIDPNGLKNCFHANNCDAGAGGDRPELAARGTDLFIVESLGDADLGCDIGQCAWPYGKNLVLFKWTDQEKKWKEWLHSANGRIGANFPVEIATVGTHVVMFAAQGATPTLWAQSAVNTNADPVSTALTSDLGILSYGADGSQGLNQSAVSMAQASHSVDADYLRIAYSVMQNGQQAVKTGLVRVDSGESVTALTDSFVTIAQNGTGSILYPTLIEAERVTDPINGDERPPVVLFWVETTLTPLPGPDQKCVHGPDGQFLPPTNWTTSWTFSEHQLADISGDGRADLVGRSGTTVMVGTSTGMGFAPPLSWTTASTAWTLAEMQLADVNGGGKAALVGRSGTTVKVGLSNGSSFAAPANWTTTTTAWTPAEMQLADVSGDGRADLVGRSGTTVFVGKSTGTGFLEPASWLTMWGTDFDLHLADVNGDAKADLVGMGAFNAQGIAPVQVALSTGTGFATPTQWTIWGTGYDMQLADVNGDGRADIIGRAGADVQVGISTGLGSFAPTGQWAVWDTNYDMQLADVNGGGAADAVGKSGNTVQARLATKLCDWGNVSVKATVFRGASQSPTYTITTASSPAWRGNGDYVHGGSRYQSPNDRFFLHWYNENNSWARLPMGRLLDVVR